MMRKKDLWPIVFDALTALSNHYIPAMDEVATRANVDRGTWALLLSVLSFDPAPVSNKILQKRMPYQEYSKRLEEGVEQGLLKADKGEYRLTEEGQELTQRIILAAYTRMERLDPLNTNDMHYLCRLLHRLVKSSHTSPEPPGKWCITHSRRFDPGDGAPTLLRIDQYLSDLAAYRDDAHMAAWQPLDFDGPTWEAFTLLWQGKADTVDTLHERLHHRRQPHEVYEHAIQTLEHKGLAEKRKGKYHLTAEGKALRQEIEEKTDAYFYAPWDCLEEEDLEALENLLKLLIEGVR